MSVDLGSFVPRPFIKRVVLEDQKIGSEERLKTTIDVVLKDKLDSMYESTWFSQEDLLYWLKVVAVIVYEPEKTLALSTNSQEMLEVVENVLTAQGGGLHVEKNEAGKIILETKKLSLNSVVGATSEASLSDFVKEQYTEKDDDGKTIYSIPYSFNFISQRQNPEHVSVFVFVGFDIPYLMGKYDLDVLSIVQFVNATSIASEIVIDKNKVKSESYALLEQATGKLWKGQAHIMNSNGEAWTGPLPDFQKVDPTTFSWMGGTSHTSGEENPWLNLITVPNNTVQDFRDFEEIEKQVLDFSFIENEVLPAAAKNTAHPIGINKENSIFSPLMLSRDSSHDCRFFFSLHFLNLMQQNTLFPRFFSSSAAPGKKKELLNASQIISLSLKRRRLQNIRSTDELPPKLLFDAFEEEEIVYTREPQFSANVHVDIHTKSNTGGSLKEITTTLATPGNSNNSNRILRHFTGTDKLMNTREGTYQYILELEVEDGTVDYLKAQLSLLQSILPFMREYYSEANQVKNYDFNANAFKAEYKKEATTWGPTITNSVALLLENIKLFSGKETIVPGKEDAEVFNSLVQIASPNYGNIRGIDFLIRVMEKFTTSFAKIVESATTKVDMEPGSIGQKSQKGASGTSTSLRTFSLRYEFQELFDADLQQMSGYDYLLNSSLDKKEQNTDGLFAVPVSYYEDRTTKELLKYFTEENPSISSNGSPVNLGPYKWTFLTPSSIQLPSRPKYNTTYYSELASNNLSKFEAQERAMAQFVVDLIKYKYNLPLQKGLPSQKLKTLEGKKEISKNLYKIFAEKNCISIKPKPPLTPIDQEILALLDNPVFAGIMGTISDQTEQALPEITEDYSKENLEPVLHGGPLGIKAVFSSLLDMSEQRLTDYNNFLQLFDSSNDEGMLSTQAAHLLPLQLKSLLLEKINTAIIRHKWFDKELAIGNSNKIARFLLDYASIVRVEVLTHYHKRAFSDEISVKEPVWKDLTGLLVLTTKNPYLLCRIVPFNMKEVGEYPDIETTLNTKTNSKNKIPYYNEYFIIDTQSSPSVSLPEVQGEGGVQAQGQLPSPTEDPTYEAPVELPSDYTQTNLNIAAGESDAEFNKGVETGGYI